MAKVRRGKRRKKFLRLREGAYDDRILRPAGRGVGGFGGRGDGFVDAFDCHASGEDLEGGIGLGLGGGLGELLVEFGGFGAGDHLDDIRAEGRADLDLEPALVGAGNVDGFVGRDERVAAPAVGKEDDGGAVALVAKDGDVSFLSAADAEGDIFAPGVGALAIDCENLDGKILGHLGEAVSGDLLHIGEALLDILGIDDAIDGLGCRIGWIWPDFCTHLGSGDGDAGFLNLAAFEPCQLGIDSDLIAAGIKAATDDALDAFDSDFFDASSRLQDAFALELAFHLEIGEAIAGHDLEFPGFTERDLQLVAEHGGERRLEVCVLIVEADDGYVDFFAGRFIAEFICEVLERIVLGG